MRASIFVGTRSVRSTNCLARRKKVVGVGAYGAADAEKFWALVPGGSTTGTPARLFEPINFGLGIRLFRKHGSEFRLRPYTAICPDRISRTNML
jgi:hypothetical protein